MKRVFIVAGETSGDLHGYLLMRQMKSLEPDCEFKGIGGTKMISLGLDAIRHASDMNFMGFAEVIRHLPAIRKAMNDCTETLETWKPDLVILIDYPGFNLRLAPLAKKRGIPVMYYISPQLWAWHTSRVKTVKKFVDRMVVLFEFEKDFYQQHGIEADFVGHPLLDVVAPGEDRTQFLKEIGAGDRPGPIIGFLPGSRKQEIERILPAMVDSIPLIREKIGSFTAVLGCAPELDSALYSRYTAGKSIVPLTGKTYDIMAYADAVAVTSGTATLETGILGTPMVIVYKTSSITYAIGKALVDIENIGMINIVAGRRIVPELWQNNVTPSTIADNLVRFIQDGLLKESVKTSLAAAREKLGGSGAAERAASIAVEMMQS